MQVQIFFLFKSYVVYQLGKSNGKADELTGRLEISPEGGQK